MKKYLNLYSVGPLIIARVPESGVPWKKLVQAAGRILWAFDLRSKDLTSIDSEGLSDTKKLEAAFAGSSDYSAFMLYDFDVATGDFKLARLNLT